MMRFEKWILVLIFFILSFAYFFGLSRMYFHQDDVDFLIGVARDWPKFLLQPVNEHVVILFMGLYRLEWQLFGTNFAGFLTVSLLLHIANLVLAGWLVFAETKSRFYAFLTGLTLTINNNWNESLWWSTGQMWLLATFFCLISLWWLSLWREKKITGFWWGLVLMIILILPGLSWGVGLIWPAIVFLGYGWGAGKKSRVSPLGYGMLASQAGLLLIYRWLSVSKMEIVQFMQLKRLGQMLIFVVVGISNTVVGRLVFPWENKLVRLLVLFGLLMILVASIAIWRRKLTGQARFLLMATVLIYLTYSLGRASFGIGAAMATRYAYLPTFFLVMAVMMILAKINFRWKDRLVLGLCLYLALSGLAVFNWRVTEWSKRPRQTKEYFALVRRLADHCLVDEPLPDFINPDQNKRRLADLAKPLNLNFRFGTEKQGCILVSAQKAL